MESSFARLIIGLQGLAFLAALIIIVYLIIRKSKIRKQENFEKRDN